MAKGKKKEDKVQREFVVGLQHLCNYPRPRRANKAISLLRKFAFKHFRIAAENVLISNKLNEFIWKRGRQHVPKKVEIKAIISEGKANLFLKGEKVSLPKEEKKEKEAEKKEEKTEEQKAEEEERQRKKEEKKIAERAAEKAAIKRGKD